MTSVFNLVFCYFSGSVQATLAITSGAYYFKLSVLCVNQFVKSYNVHYERSFLQILIMVNGCLFILALIMIIPTTQSKK